MKDQDSCTILVAEDDEFLSRAYEFKLNKIGCRVVLAKDGEETLEKLKSEKPDLLLLDIIMPKKTGFEVLEEMKTDTTLRGIPVIVMSNLGQEADIKKGLAAGAIDYVVKAHTSLEEVVQRIIKALKNKKSIRWVPPPKESPQAKECPECKKPVPKGAKFCPECGKKMD